MKTYLIFAALAVFTTACSKPRVIPPPPPPASSGNTTTTSSTSSQRATIAEFTVEPASIERGQSAVVRWSVTNATDVAIDKGLGTVQNTGTRRVIPNETTTYTLTANGVGGAVTATATVTVTGPAPPPPPPTATANSRGGTLESRIESDLQDALFEYDSNNISEGARGALTADADALKHIFADFPNASINIEGHCDERGSAEYNLGLGDRRASAARDFLAQLGVPVDRLKTISYGKERPACTESNESCWQRNRRAHFSTGQ